MTKSSLIDFDDENEVASFHDYHEDLGEKLSFLVEIGAVKRQYASTLTPKQIEDLFYKETE